MRLDATPVEIHCLIEAMHEEVRAFNQLTDLGWTLHDVPQGYPSYSHLQQLEAWAVVNCQGKFKRMGTTWAFELVSDYTWFVMRWE